jgi:hypothetical protein
MKIAEGRENMNLRLVVMLVVLESFGIPRGYASARQQTSKATPGGTTLRKTAQARLWL